METRSREALPHQASSDAQVPPPPPVTETLAEAPRRRGAGSLKRKASSNLSSTPSKRLIKERNALNIPSVHNGPCTRARQSPNKLPPPPPATSAPAPVDERGNHGLAAGGPISIEEEEELAPLDEPIVDPEFDLVRSRGSDVHVVPTPAGWFSWKEIHQIEKHTLTSFFNGKFERKTPEIYMETRNSIMRKFHADPQTQLELNDLEEISAGDLEVKQEIFEFLDHWGLINFHPFPPENIDVQNSDVGDDYTDSLLEKLFQFEAVHSLPALAPKKVEVLAPAVAPHLLSESSIAEELVGPVGPSVEYHCNSCSADCSRKRYHCQKQADFDLCSECYNDGKFGSGMAPSDFILMESAEVPGMSGGSWTDQETLLLLEALELFGENWSEIAEHVATKTKSQCMLHFLQMPIEDPFLEDDANAGENVQEQVDPSLANKETTTSDVPMKMEIENAVVSSPLDVSKRKVASEFEASGDSGVSLAIDALKFAFQAIGYMPEQEELPSFAETGNPVMALAAFLTRLVEPGVATTSYRSSLKAISEDSPGIHLATRHCFILEDPPNDKKDSPISESPATTNCNGEGPKEENQVPALNGTDESKLCTDKDDESVVSVENKNPPMGSDMDLSIECEKNPLENDKSPSTGNEKSPSTGNEKSLFEENEKSPSDGNEKTPAAGNEETPAAGNERSPSAGKEKGQSVENETSQSSEKEISNSADKEMSQSAEQEKNKSTENENSISVESGNGLSLEKEKDLSISLPDCLEKSSATKESDESISPPKAPHNSIEDSGNPTVLEEQIVASAVKDRSDSATPKVISSTNPEDVGDLDFLGKASPNATDDGNDMELAGEDTSNTAKQSDNLASVNMSEQTPDTSVAVHLEPSAKDQESNPETGIVPALGSTNTADGDDRKVSPSNNDGVSTPTGTDDDPQRHKINKLQRAAVTILSAAAVKAKLLAGQEEDQIRQLVSLVIEKQLQKLETKLTLFTDMESVVMKMKEHVETARQRVMHERNQIIAARYGLSSVPSRVNLSLPTGKSAMSYGLMGPNPHLIASQKPQPIKRP